MNAEAYQDYLRALAVSEKLMNAYPTDTDLVYDYMHDLSKVGDFCVVANQLPEAKRTFEQLSKISQQLLSAGNAHPDATQYFLMAQTKLGDVCVFSGESGAAIQHYLEAYKIVAQLLEPDPRNPIQLRNLALIYRAIAAIYDSLNRYADAGAFYLRCLQAMHQIHIQGIPFDADAEALYRQLKTRLYPPGELHLA